MEFAIKPFKELLGMCFNIPSYQRGYRWEPENVRDLLDDLQEFAVNPTKEKGEFYCLQPVVVRKNVSLSEQKGFIVYDVLDGQQRLTTLWLILSNLTSTWNGIDRSHPDLYTLIFETRTDLLTKAIDENSNGLDNIDLFYLKEAYATINCWAQQGELYPVVNTIVPKSSTTDTNDLRVIWYEFDKDIQEQGHTQSSSIKVFSRLNYGKIALTDTELIKAILFQSDIYPDDDSEVSRSVMKERLFRFSTEWDDMEKRLQDKAFWGMLTPKEYTPFNHLELIFRFVAHGIQKEEGYKITDQQHKDFYIISTFLKISGAIIPAEYANKVEEIWNRVRDTYHAMQNWFVKNEFYHLIGLLTLLKGGKDPIPLLEDVFDHYKKNNKENFQRYLEGQIGKLIEIKEKMKDTSAQGRLLALSELTYQDQKSRIQRILEAFNVYLQMNEKNGGNRFRFDLFKDYSVTSLEHIHPQHLDFDNGVKHEEVKNWYDTMHTIVEKELLPARKELLSDMKMKLEELNTLLRDEDRFNEVKQRCQEIVDSIDPFLDKQIDMTDDHMHTLYNLALVDKDTNAALSNHLLDRKRNILQQREAEEKTYVPIATRFVFNKHFSPEISTMKFWRKEDREAYFKKIEEAYHYFINKIKK